MMTEQQIKSDLAIPPGEFLLEVLEDEGITQAELSRRMGRPPQMINEVIKGDKSITPETAIQLEHVLGVPAHIWASLESEYRLIKAGVAEIEAAKSESGLAKTFPYNELVKLDLVPKTRDLVEKVQNLRSFFGVASLNSIMTVNAYQPAFRQAATKDINENAIASWLRAGSLKADAMKLAPFNKEELSISIPKLRELTQVEDPKIMVPKLMTILSDCGVALVLIPHFPKTGLTGATFWSKDHPVVMMSLRGCYADIFWFSLFHELGHILLHDKRVTFLEGNNDNTHYVKQEQEADKFAQNTLIPPNKLKEFFSYMSVSSHSIARFANEIDIAPGIVTGRLQHEKILPYTRHFHRVKYQWVK